MVGYYCNNSLFTMPFRKGDPNINRNGRPTGSYSLKSKIIKYLEEHPEKEKELLDYYMNSKDNKIRDLLWRMIDGSPSQSLDHNITVPQTLLDLVRDARHNK